MGIVRAWPGRSPASSDVYSGLFGDDLGALADGMDAAQVAHKSSRTVGVAWVRDMISDLDGSPTSV